MPLLGTCGGFQHIILEFARNVAGIKDAAHAENDPCASVLFISKLTCSLVGQTMSVTIQPRQLSKAFWMFQGGTYDTLAHRSYGTLEAQENYYCNFGLNPEHLSSLTDAGLIVSGHDANNEVRIVELPNHPFFVGTLFVPQTRPNHPLVAALYRSAQKTSFAS